MCMQTLDPQTFCWEQLHNDAVLSGRASRVLTVLRYGGDPSNNVSDSPCTCSHGRESNIQVHLFSEVKAVCIQ